MIEFIAAKISVTKKCYIRGVSLKPHQMKKNVYAVQLKRLALGLCLFALATSCHKKDDTQSADSTSTTETTTTDASSAKNADTMSVVADTSKTAAASTSNMKYNDDPQSIKNALDAIKKAGVKTVSAGNKIELGSNTSEAKKCVTVTFKDGATGEICASKAAIDGIRKDCGDSHDCTVTDQK